MAEEKVVTEEKVEVAPEAVETSEANSTKPQRKGDRRQAGSRRSAHSPRREIVKEYEEKVVKINRVTKVVKGGKRMKFAALVVIGNKKGKYGFGTGKSGEVPDAIRKAVDRSKRELFSVQIVKGGTIAHEVSGKFGATTVFLKPAPEGTGIIAGGAVRNLIELVGIQNVYSKVYGSRTPINVVRATHAALASLKSYGEVESLRRGGNDDAQ